MRSEVVVVESKSEIERYARRNIHLHLYEIGDLDPFFWPSTTWYGLRDPGGELNALAMLYRGLTPATLLAFAHSDPHRALLEALVGGLTERLPVRLYTHLSPGLARSFDSQKWSVHQHGRFSKMALHDVKKLGEVNVDGIERLGVRNVAEIEDLYERSYPGNWFDRRMLETNHYFGARVDGRLVAVAGVHVYSKEYGVAALGNITTDPDHRRRGHGRRATGKLCQTLLETVDVVGLNVKADNRAAITCYEHLGFEVVAEYEEAMLEPAD